MAVRYRYHQQSKYYVTLSLHGILIGPGYDHHNSKADACDVINFEEYEDVVIKILEKKPTRAITIFINMKDVEKSIRVRTLMSCFISMQLILPFRKTH